MHIAEFQQWVKDADRETQWELVTTLQLLCHLTEEVGELAQAINRIYGYAEERDKCLANLGSEIVDVFWFLIKIANRFGVDLDLKAQDLVRRADGWPADRIERYRRRLIDSLRTLDGELAAAKDSLDLGSGL